MATLGISTKLNRRGEGEKTEEEEEGNEEEREERRERRRGKMTRPFFFQHTYLVELKKASLFCAEKRQQGRRNRK